MKTLTRAAAPGSVSMARILSGRIAKFWIWAEDTGLPLDPSRLFTPVNVDRFCTMRVSPASQRSVQAHLRRVGRKVAPDRWPARAPRFNRRAHQAPYSQEEVGALFEAARSLRTRTQREFVNNLLLCSLGCGLNGTEMTEVRGTDVRMERGAVLVHVAGRTVPCRQEYEEALWQAASAIGGGHLVAPRLDRRLAIVRGVFAKAGFEVPISTIRLRMTWLVQQLTDEVPILVLLRGAGIKSMSGLDAARRFVPEMDDEAYISWLRGARP
ncbi:MAG: hypothetical protein M0Z69_08960 [Actinomycetota bacterium]|nr:hypothetical protein [Actinomycetota bacterium]